MANRPPKLTRGDRARRHERIVAAYTAGENSRVVAERFGMDQSHVCSILRLYGVIRKRSA